MSGFLFKNGSLFIGLPVEVYGVFSMFLIAPGVSSKWLLLCLLGFPIPYVDYTESCKRPMKPSSAYVAAGSWKILTPVLFAVIEGITVSLMA